MPKSPTIELDDGAMVIPILYEDRAVMALDKPAGWMLAPDSWDRTGRNLQLALQSSLNAGDFWARSRNLKYFRFIHRLDAETSGVVLFARSPGALRSLSELFETRQVEKRYLAVVHGVPAQVQWTCTLPIMPDPGKTGRMRASAQPSRRGEAAGFKAAETHFQVLMTSAKLALVEARPVTGRTHQIRVHLAAAGHPVVEDPLYGESTKTPKTKRAPAMALRAVRLAYRDPFQNRPVTIRAPVDAFLEQYGFKPKSGDMPTGEAAAA